VTARAPDASGMDSVRELRFLQRLALVASSTLDSRELMNLVISETTEAAVTDVCSIYLLEAEGGTLVLTATNGLSQAGVGRVRMQVGEGITGWAAAERRPVVVPDVRAEPRFRWLHGVDQARFVSMCSVPIISGDRLVGVLNVQTDDLRQFSDADVGLLSAIAAQVAGALERGELQARLQARIAELRRSEEINRRFSELTLSRAGLRAICTGIERHAGAAVAIYDEEGERLGGSVEGELPHRLEGFADPARREDDLTIVPVRAGRDLLGWLVVAPAAACEESARRLAIEHGVTVLALELVRRRSSAETEERLRGDLLEELLATKLSGADASRLARRASRLGVRIRGAVWALVLEPDDAEAEALLDSPSVRRRVARGLGDLVAEGGGLAVNRGAGFVLLVPGDPSLEQVERLARSAIEVAMARAGGASMTAGISSGSGDAVDLHRLAGEAQHAVRVSQRAGRRAVVGAYRRLGVDRVLFEVADADRLAAFVDEFIGLLLRHGERGPAAAPLLETLEALVTESWNLRAAARRLTVHINTLLYRVRRIEELTGRRLDDSEERLALAMALRARVMLGHSDDASDEMPGQSQTEHPYRGSDADRTLAAVSQGVDMERGDRDD
jgi:sugar diacid utilization regulator/putative methionine-R-sulfoxide reductase with GAF domain